MFQKRLDFAEAESKQLKAQLQLVNQWVAMELEQYETNESQGPEPLFEALEKRFKRAAELRAFYTTQYEGHVKQLQDATHDLSELLEHSNSL
jgi:hypothetical protein